MFLNTAAASVAAFCLCAAHAQCLPLRLLMGVSYLFCVFRYPTEQKQVDFARTAVYKLEHLDFVERYAWYALPNGGGSGENNGLFWGDGKMSYVGTAYKAAHS